LEPGSRRVILYEIAVVAAAPAEDVAVEAVVVTVKAVRVAVTHHLR
jgi:hypothetical protein